MSAAHSTLTAERLRELLHYDPETGLFSWKVDRCNIKTGTKAGTPMVNGYLCIRADRKLHLAHRLAWLYHYGEPPPSLIDHIDGDKKNNRISNLRLGTKVTNGQNRRKAQANNKSSGLLGVAWIGHTSKYTAYIDVGGKRTYLGLFNEKEEAHATYIKAKRELHEGCTI